LPSSRPRFVPLRFNKSEMHITYYGHSCFLLEVGGKRLLFDPFITGNDLAKDILVDSISCDYIFVSHGHADHIADCVRIAKRTEAKVVASWEVAAWLNAKGVINTHPMNLGGKWSFEGFSVKCVVAQHSSSMPDGSYGGSPMGFIIRTADAGSIYYTGDTALTLDMQLIPMWAPELHVVLMPIGDNFTMDVEDAIEAARMIDCHRIVGLHYDTFGYIKIDKEDALNAFAAAGKELILMPIGSQMTV
jgi:L-ascorbate metabolism protein UlaG (beta-lactamase superfamily)